MNRKSSFIVFLVSAAITVGILGATVGKPPYLKHHSYFETCNPPAAPVGQQK